MKIKLLALILGIALVIGLVSGCTEEKDEDEEDKNTAPVAAFEYGPTVEGNYTVEQNIWFNASGSTDDDGDDLTYSWEFGDGETGAGVNVSHNYSEAGSYVVNLTVNDGTVDSEVVSETINVDAVATNAAPTAIFEYNVTDYNETKNMSYVTFTDMSSDSDGAIVNWTWDFGDGTDPTIYTTSPDAIQYEYNLTTLSMNYTAVTLTVTDDGGLTDTVTVSEIILDKTASSGISE